MVYQATLKFLEGSDVAWCVGIHVWQQIIRHRTSELMLSAERNSAMMATYKSGAASFRIGKGARGQDRPSDS